MVKQKIAAQKPQAAAQTQTFGSQPAAPPSQQPAKPAEKAEAPQTPQDDSATADGNQTVSDLIKESMAIASGYDPEGRIDPFEPLFKEEPDVQVATTSKKKHKKRIPQTPLERVALSQLKLSAIMRTSRGNSAIVEDATGKGYVIRKGTYIGLNSGQVTQIEKDRVVIEEETENIMGELVIQNTELKLQKPAGEL